MMSVWPWIIKHGIAIGIVAAIVAGIALWDHERANRLRSEGADEIRRGVERENARATKIGEKAARQSGNPAPRPDRRRVPCLPGYKC